MTTVRHLSTLAALALHAAGIGIAMSMPSGAPPVEPKEIPITLTMAPLPEPPAPKVEAPKPDPKPEPKPVVRETPPPQPVPQPSIEPPPAVIASAATSVAESVVPEAPPPPPPPPPPNPGALKAKDDYFGRVLAWLERHKRYPGEARSRRTQGTAMVWFVMDRQGRVHGSKLHKTSGYPVLDDAALKMVQRASPLPAMPPEMPDQQVELVVPVEFYIR
jgi:protein TonB